MFLNTNKSFADTLFASSTNTISGGQNGCGTFPLLGQYDVVTPSVTAVLSKISFPNGQTKVAGIYWYPPTNFEIREGSPTGDIIASDMTMNTDDDSLFFTPNSSPVILYASHTYYFIVTAPSYSCGAWWNGAGGYPSVPEIDLYTFDSAPPSAYINIIKPQNETVITNQASTTPPYRFEFWGVDYFLPDAATGTTATLFLDYSSFPDDKIKYQEQFINLPIDDYIISTSTQFYFGKTYFLPNGDYKAKAYMQYQLAGTTTQTIIYSDDVFFTISEAGGISYSTSTTSTIPIPNFEDICTAPQGGFLDYPTQNINYALCKAFSYLFIPNQEQQQNIQNRFSSFQDIIKSKPPLGYFYKIKDALNQNITTGNATTTQILNTSTTQAFSAVFSPLKTGLNWVLWLAAGSWVFIKIKNLNI